ncbi:MAG: extracellular solute-binding protein [Candidatus Hydrogenedentes bacterium]|nr:extracellular solute-binding protein [Candidatus Hydrogenedentota bacterium]
MIGLGLGLFLLFAVSSCIAADPPKSPEEALLRANTEINRILESSANGTNAEIPVQPATGGGAEITFWYYAHPAVAAAVESIQPQFGSLPVRALYIGEWDVAVQKLLVSIVSGQVPDVALVKRDLVAPLYRAGRIRALDSILPESLLDDFRDEVFTDYAYEGRLCGLPADGYCSVLFYNRRFIGDTPPKTWVFFSAHLNAHRSVTGLENTRGYGAVPFVEALWSAGGDVINNGRGALDTPAAARALHFVLDATADVPRGEDSSFREFTEGKIAMTAASSQRFAQAAKGGFPVGIAPVPGETGPISRRSNDAVVVFARDGGADSAAIAALIEWLTGPSVYSEKAQQTGNVPIRKSITNSDAVQPGFLEAYASGRNTPLVSDWGTIEAEVNRAVAQAYAGVNVLVGPGSLIP